MDPVVHFEMPYDDASRLTSFYEAAFGWQTQRMGAEMGDYVLATTTPTENGMIATPGNINGGFFPKRPGGPSTPSVVISVDDIAASIDKVKQAGGTVLAEPIDIPGVGRYAPFTDTEGNTLSMLQPLPRG